MYKHLEHIMCKELEMLEDKYRDSKELAEGDLRRIDLLVHSLKSMATYNAMKEAEEYRQGDPYANNSYKMNNSYMNNNGMNSYTQGHGMDGRFVSRDMNQSGHYPMNYQPMYPEDRRW